MLFGVLSRSTIVVDPVVVIPDILSKKDSLNDKSRFDSRNGKLPNRAMLIHDKVEKKKACWRFSWLSFFRLARTVNTQ